MGRISVLLFTFIVSFFIIGCVPSPKSDIQKPITVTVQPPPTPPTAADLEKPPNLILEKPGRDPFVALVTGEGVASKGGAVAGLPLSSLGAGGGGNYVLSGVMMGPNSSAIIEAGPNSYIVHRGDRVEGYRVLSVNPRKVVLARGKETLILSLSR